jgi:hypothetical protein
MKMQKSYLLHISHYDPAWCAEKDREEMFDTETAGKIIRKLKALSFDSVIADCADGLKYESHPELKRKYSSPKSLVADFAAETAGLGMDIIPKLNFSKSGRNKHDMWMAPHSDLTDWTGSIDTGVYWTVAEDLINELTDLFRPKHFFHIGMDEDHYRSVNQYAETIIRLDGMIKKRGLRTMVWNDSCYCDPASPNKHHAEKCEAAEAFLPGDITHVLWEYSRPRAKALRRLKQRGFKVWAAPGANPRNIEAWKACLSEERGDGILMTNWIKCSKTNEAELLRATDRLGPLF